VEPEAELTVLPAPSGPGGEGGIRAIDVSKEGRGFAMSVLSEHKEEVVALMDFMASPEGQMLDRLGFEGEHYTRNGDAIEVTDAISTWYARFMAASNWEAPVQWMSEAAAQSLEEDWDDFVAEWNAAGGERLTEYARSVL
jgi:putative aldouronate transport system substrate-binding protein